MLNYGTDAMLVDGNGETILHQACKFNNEALVKVLIERKVELDAKDNLGKTAFLHAAENGHTNCVKRLLRARVDPTIGNKWNAVGLHYACSNGHLHTAVTILKAALLKPPNGVLMQVIRHNKCKLFDENVEEVNLLKEECCLNNVDVSGETPFYKACYRNHLNVARALIDRGADITIKAGDFFPFDLIKPGKELDKLERQAAKVARLIVRVKQENSIEMDKTEQGSIVVAKTKKVIEMNALTSLEDMKTFYQFAVKKPEDFEINIRDISNKIRLLSLRRLDVIKESKSLLTGPYLYHKDLKRRVMEYVDAGLEAYTAKNLIKCYDLWEVATQLQQLKDWVAVALLRDKPIDKEQSDRLYNVFRLFSVYQTKRSITHAAHIELLLRVGVVQAGFHNDNKEYDVAVKKKKKKKKKKKNII
jgi:ankyrin repeat protein